MDTKSICVTLMVHASKYAVKATKTEDPELAERYNKYARDMRDANNIIKSCEMSREAEAAEDVVEYSGTTAE